MNPQSPTPDPQTPTPDPDSTPPVSPKATRTWKRRILFRFATAAICLVLCLLVVEVLLHILWGAPLMHFPPDAVREDPETGFGLVPNFHGRVNNGYFRGRFDTNSQGFRDSERTLEKPAGVYRVLLVGDSFVQGFAMKEEEVFASVAERELKARRSNPPVEIVKVGVGGWGPSNYYRFLKNRGMLYSPDLVVVVFYPGNDFQDVESERYEGVWNGVWLKRFEIRNMTSWRRLRVALWKHVYLYGFLDSWLRGRGGASKYEMEHDRDFLLQCMPGSTLPPGKSTKESFQSIQAWCAEHKIKLRVLILPHRSQIERKRADDLGKMFRIDVSKLDYSRPPALLDQYFREMSIESWNPASALRDWTKDGSPISFPANVHYTATTHAFLGKEYLVPKLAETIPATLQP